MTVLPPITLGEPAQLDLTAYRGDSGRFRVNVTQGGAPLDVSAAEWDADIRATADAPVLATMTVTPVVGQTNSVDVELPSGSSTQLSGEAVWDLEMTLGGRVTTLLRGAITITPDVSRPTFAPPEPPPGATSAMVALDPESAPEAPTSAPAASGAGAPPIAPGVTPERIGGPEGEVVQEMPQPQEVPA